MVAPVAVPLPRERARDGALRAPVHEFSTSAMTDQEAAIDAELTRTFLSFRMLKEALQSTSIQADEEVRLVLLPCFLVLLLLAMVSDEGIRAWY